jgi:hypothetical protein
MTFRTAARRIGAVRTDSPDLSAPLRAAAWPAVVYDKPPQPWVIAALFSGELRRLPVPYIVYRLISAGSPRVD